MTWKKLISVQQGDTGCPGDQHQLLRDIEYAVEDLETEEAS